MTGASTVGFSASKTAPLLPRAVERLAVSDLLFLVREDHWRTGKREVGALRRTFAASETLQSTVDIVSEWREPLTWSDRTCRCR